MRTAHARRSGPSPHSAAPAVWDGSLRALAVVVLMMGIVTMHSLGLGHGLMPAGHSPSAAMTEMTGITGITGITGTSAVSPTGSRPAADAVHTSPAAVRIDGASHGMTAMCLAVLPLLMLLLARLLGWRVAALVHTARSSGGRSVDPSNRAPPGHLRPSLLKLCILRT